MYALLYARIFVYRTQSAWIDFIGVIVVLLNFVSSCMCCAATKFHIQPLRGAQIVCTPRRYEGLGCGGSPRCLKKPWC